MQGVHIWKIYLLYPFCRPISSGVKKKEKDKRKKRQSWPPTLLSRFGARKFEAKKKEHGSTKKKEHEKSKSAESERKKREFMLFLPFATQNWKPGSSAQSHSEGRKQGF
jgi:hypothetical protein